MTWKAYDWTHVFASCHGNHEWMKGLAEALKINTALIFKAPAKRFIEPWFQWQIWFGLTSFQNTFSIMSLRKAQHWLNPPKVCKSNLHTALSHCTASWHFSALHYQFQMAPIIRENVCVLDNFSAWSSINRINGQKCHQKKMTWMTCMMHGMVPCSCCTSRSSTGLHAGKSRFVMVAMTWKVYDWTHVFASFVMETTSEWKVWPRHWRSTRRWSSRPQPNVSSSHGFNDKFGFGLTSFQNTFSIMSLHKAQHWLNPPKVCKSNLHTALSHCTASWHFSALHYQFQMAPIIRENVCVLDNFSAWSSINRINGQKCHQKKMTWMTCMMHGMVPCSCCTSRSSTGLQAGKSRFVMVAMTWKVYDWTHVFASFVMETTSEWKVWPRHWRSTRRWSSRPQPNVSSSHGFNDKFGLGWLPFRTPSVSCHSARLNIGSTLQRSAKVTCTLHCRTALPLGISVRFIISFKWPPSYVKTSASWTISLREVASIESMGKNAIKKKWHGWPAWCTAWSLVHAVPQEARLDCRPESPGSSWSPWHGRSTTEHMFLPALSWKPRVNERSGRSLGGQHGVIFKAPAKRFIEPWFQWQIWFGLTSFQNTFSIMSLRKAQHWLNPPKVCKSNLHTALSHCTASWHFSALHYQFQMAPIIRENVCVLDNFSAWSSINRINGQKCHQKKMTWMTCMMHGMVPCSCCTSRSSTGLQVGKSRFVMVAMTWKVYDWTHVFASFVMETTSEWKVWPKPWRSTRRDLQGPSQTFHRAMVSMTNLVWALGWLPFRTPSVSCHSARLNIGSTLQRSAKVTCTLHCRTALPLGISVRFIISFKWPPSYVKTSASWTISLREVASIESMGKNAIKKKWHGWPAWCTAWSLVHAVPQEARLDCRPESPGSSWSPWHGRSTTEHMFLPALSWKPRVNERSGRSLGGQHGVIFKAPAKRFIEPWFQWQIWFGLTFGLTSVSWTPSVSCQRLNIGSTLQRSAKVTCTLHCRTALPLGISVRFIISFKWPPSYVKTSASWTISLREVASIESMGKNAIKKKWHGWPAWCTAWSLVHAVPQEARLDCRPESPGSSWSPWHGRSTTDHMLLPALSWKPRVNERSGRSLGGQHGVDLQGPSQTFHRAMVSMTNLVWADFLSEHLQYHVTPQGSTLAQPSKGLQK